MVEDRPAIIIDNGSGHVKAGLAGLEAPSCVFPAIIGRPKHGSMMGQESKEQYIGEDAIAKKGVLKLTYPIEHGIVTDWNDLEKVWHHTYFDQLRVNPEDHNVVVTEAPMNPKKNRERMVELLFDKFSVPAAYIVIQAVMSLYSNGRTTGCVLDSGDGVSHVVPVYEGYMCPHAVQRMDLAGRDLSEYFAKLLASHGHNMQSSSEREIVRDMKETTCYVLQGHVDEEEQAAKERPTDYEKVYTLPDGNQVVLRDERYKVPEVLFSPIMCGRELKGIHQATYDCIRACDIDMRKDLFKSIILSGGTTMFPGIAERLTKEVKALAPMNIDVKVIASPQRRYIVWMGASIVSQLTNFDQMLITKREYDEDGARIVHAKCF